LLNIINDKKSNPRAHILDTS